MAEKGSAARLGPAFCCAAARSAWWDKIWWRQKWACAAVSRFGWFLGSFFLDTRVCEGPEAFWSSM